MLTRVILAAGVAALAIAAPASAERGGKGGDDRQRAANVERGGGGERAQRAQRVERRAARLEQRSQGAERRSVRLAQRSDRMEQRANRLENRGAERRAARVETRANRVEQRAQRVENRGNRIEQRAQRVDNRGNRAELRAQRIDRIQERGDRRALQASRIENRFDRQAAQINRQALRDERRFERQLMRNELQAQRWARIDESRATRQALAATRLAALDNRIATQFIEPVRVRTFIGQPLNTVTAFTPLVALPQTISYLYPDTDDYYYRYGGGYVYRVERDNDLIDWILPLLAGGFMPGQYLPTSYMNSYVPDYYGFNSFYPASYGTGYGYGYDNLCNRYVNGVIYQVDCYTGLIQDVVPLYASGYGVGQMLPVSYNYYNVPTQYRSLYYNTPDYNYWYAPGAIYQVDPTTSLITSVAALLSPGMTVGQRLPMGYNAYNVPLGYREMYYDTPNAWYRYNNGYIYQVDPTTMLVTAIVASILT